MLGGERDPSLGRAVIQLPEQSLADNAPHLSPFYDR